jgi:hypothetical protein
VRAGKVIELELAETDAAKAQAQAEEMARRLLANTVIESFRVEVGCSAVIKASLLVMAVLTVLISIGLRWREERMPQVAAQKRLGMLARGKKGMTAG